MRLIYLFTILVFFFSFSCEGLLFSQPHYFSFSLCLRLLKCYSLFLPPFWGTVISLVYFYPSSNSVSVKTDYFSPFDPYKYLLFFWRGAVRFLPFVKLVSFLLSYGKVFLLMVVEANLNIRTLKRECK